VATTFTGNIMFITVAAATLPSVPLDFLGNRDRIIESIRIAKAKGATVRAGPELEVPGRVVALFFCRRLSGTYLSLVLT
jgi:predicted amidohydrolase